MKSLAAVVRRGSAEAVRRTLADEGLLRGDLKVQHDGNDVVFPIAGPPAASIDPARLEEREFDGPTAAEPESYRDALNVPSDVRESLPRAFDVVGDVVLIRIPASLRAHGPEVGRALLGFVPGARIVGLDLGVHGETRLRRLERLAGEGPWTTTHRENGLQLEADLERAYFSPRLAREHADVAGQVRTGERVIDFACGVGPFSAAIVRDGRAREVVAVDLNPRATELAERNLRRAGSATPFRVVTASIEAFAPSTGTCDRAILNLPHGGVKYLAPVAATVARGGTLHYYELTERPRAEGRPEELMNELNAQSGDRWVVDDRHIVHAYSPTEDLVAYRLVRS
ncbi:MAG TPA: methyltransferase domain-containing protein [Thermoplasmata archaeon]|jgi:tRNA (guanine37-N1)-methyltransferase|nr:methyltransferase domain-containing protein [Thermoplasmata archaeon]